MLKVGNKKYNLILRWDDHTLDSISGVLSAEREIYTLEAELKKDRSTMPPTNRQAFEAQVDVFTKEAYSKAITACTIGATDELFTVLKSRSTLELQGWYYMLKKATGQSFESWFKKQKPEPETEHGKTMYYVNMPLVSGNDLMLQALLSGSFYDFVVWTPYVIGVKGQDYLMPDGSHISKLEFVGLSVSERIEIVRQQARLNRVRIDEFIRLPISQTMPLVSYYFDRVKEIQALIGSGSGGGVSDDPVEIARNQQTVKHIIAKYLGVKIPEIELYGMQEFALEYKRMVLEAAEAEKARKAAADKMKGRKGGK